VAIDPRNRLVVVAFRGSETFRDVLTDLGALNARPKINCMTCGLVASGFDNAYEEVRAQINNAVTTALSQNPGFRVVATGHSLGGALAIFASFDLRITLRSNVPVDLVRFSQLYLDRNNGFRWLT
jgi:cephalosporin-C deacetylase-like acetyl esterase